MDASILIGIAREAASRATSLDSTSLVPGSPQALEAAFHYQRAAVALGTLVFSSIEVAGGEAMHSHALQYAERAFLLGFTVEDHAARTGVEAERLRLHPILQQEVVRKIRSTMSASGAASPTSIGLPEAGRVRPTAHPVAVSTASPDISSPHGEPDEYTMSMTMAQSARDLSRAGQSYRAKLAMSAAAELAVSGCRKDPSSRRMAELAGMLVEEAEALSRAASAESSQTSGLAAESDTGISPDGAAKAATDAISEAQQLRKRFRSKEALVSFTRGLDLCAIALQAGPGRCSLYGVSVSAAVVAIQASAELRGKLGGGAARDRELRQLLVSARQAELRCQAAGGHTLSAAQDRRGHEEVAGIRASEPRATPQAGYPFAAPLPAAAGAAGYPASLRAAADADAEAAAGRALAEARAAARAREERAVASTARAWVQAQQAERAALAAELAGARGGGAGSRVAFAVAPPGESGSGEAPIGDGGGGEARNGGSHGSGQDGGGPSGARDGDASVDAVSAKLAEAEAAAEAWRRRQRGEDDDEDFEL